MATAYETPLVGCAVGKSLVGFSGLSEGLRDFPESDEETAVPDGGVRWEDEEETALEEVAIGSSVFCGSTAGESMLPSGQFGWWPRPVDVMGVVAERSSTSNFGGRLALRDVEAPLW